MTVQQLIDELMALPDKELPVYVEDGGGLDYPEVTECIMGVGEGDEEMELIVLMPAHNSNVFAKLPVFDSA